MPAISPSQICESIIDACSLLGHSVVLTSNKRAHPRTFALASPNGIESVWIYIWTVTHGGATRDPNEYRIQMTSVKPPLDLNPNGYTVLLGYNPELEVFAGFDLDHHKNFTVGSPSIQIGRDALVRSIQSGLAFDKKANGEIAIAIRPDHLFAYICNSSEMHRYGKNAHAMSALELASGSRPVPESNLEVLGKKRRKIIERVSRYSRDANFRNMVVTAYANRCAVTRMQLNLVEAAHIVPVVVQGSADHVTNGMALSPTYHRAYDAGLIYLNTDYQMKINEKKLDVLKSSRLAGGIDRFASCLGRIHLPPDEGQWPSVEFISQANKHRSVN